MTSTRGDHPRIGADDIHLAAQLFQPARLTLARELRKLTKASLADRVGKTPSAVSQFESGRIRPDGSTVGAMALVLDVPLLFFTKDLHSGVMSVEQCHFRSLRSASQRDRRCLLARGTLLCDLADVLARYVDIPPERVLRIDREVRSKRGIEVLAKEVRDHWGLGSGPISNIVWLIENNGVLVSYIPSDCESVDAFSGSRQSAEQARPFIFLTDVKGATARSRFDAAHELGHLVMHVDAQPGNPELEQQANQFAGAFLMPRESFVREAPKRLNWPLIWELKRRWRTSARAILYRAHDLGVLSDASYRRGFVQLNQRHKGGEPFEPERERPVLLAGALDATCEEVDPGNIAAELGIRPRQLADLVPDWEH